MDDGRTSLWSRISRREQAAYVARMAGLPVFLMGAFSAVVAGISLIDGDRPAEDGTTLVVGLFLIVSGLRFRAGKLGLLPVVAAVMVVDFTLRFLGPVDYRIVVPAAFTLMALNGLRGWWWLRRHPA